MQKKLDDYIFYVIMDNLLLVNSINQNTVYNKDQKIKHITEYAKFAFKNGSSIKGKFEVKECNEWLKCNDYVVFHLKNLATDEE